MHDVVVQSCLFAKFYDWEESLDIIMEADVM